jgi:hypothetical protein
MPHSSLSLQHLSQPHLSIFIIGFVSLIFIKLRGGKHLLVIDGPATTTTHPSSAVPHTMDSTQGVSRIEAE